MKIQFITGLLLFAATITYGQELAGERRMQITAGLSTTDAPNLGIRYRKNQSQWWFNVGLSAIGRNSHFISLGPGFSQHLWGASKKTDLKPWYVKLGLTGIDYALPLTRQYTERAQITYAKVHLGRDFNITKRAGFTFSIGPSARVYQKWNGPYERTAKIDLINYASFDVNVFYKLR
jgi:hypothetical protein